MKIFLKSIKETMLPNNKISPILLRKGGQPKLNANPRIVSPPQDILKDPSSTGFKQIFISCCGFWIQRANIKKTSILFLKKIPPQQMTIILFKFSIKSWFFSRKKMGETKSSIVIIIKLNLSTNKTLVLSHSYLAK